MADHHDHDHPAPDDTDCSDALAEIYTYLDGELTEERRALIAGHLAGCNPCIEAFDFEAELRIVISTRARRDAVPEELRIRILERLTMLTRGEAGGAGDGPRSGEPPAREA
ncbi:MAG: mycothiol system anti-sigma-R factor [Acidobacteria bacterium]|nr:mycothiol system anti-sigma-R factor [Acidobacteriota bacterium]